MTKKKAAVAPKDSSANIDVQAMTCTMLPLIDRIITNRTPSRALATPLQSEELSVGNSNLNQDAST